MQRKHRFGISLHQKSLYGRSPPEPAGELTALPTPRCTTGGGASRQERGEEEGKEEKEGEGREGKGKGRWDPKN